MVRTNRTRFTAAVAALAFAALPGLAQAGGGAPRTETGTYFAGGPQGVLALSAAGQENLGAVRFPAGTERFVSVTIVDTTGLPISGEVAQNLDADETPEVSYTFCGATEKPVKVKPRVEVTVYLYEGTCGSSPSLATHGQVTAEFTAKR